MSAPKQWGYTRKSVPTDEMLMAWVDGDLTAALSREVEEHLLSNESSRINLKDLAAHCENSTPEDAVKERVAKPGKNIMALCMGLKDEGDAFAVEMPVAGSVFAPGKVFLGMILLAISAGAAFWMIQNF